MRKQILKNAGIESVSYTTSSKVQPTSHRADALLSSFSKPELVEAAKAILNKADQSEEAFLGAQGVLLLNGLI